jgi:hypothetical protein
VPDERIAGLTRAVLVIALLKVMLHALTSAQGYGYFGDEFYYLACARRLDWGYVDHPPLSIAVLTAWISLFGDSLASIRMAPAIFGGLSVVLAGHLTRELGGARRAQSLAALVTALAPVNLVVHGYYSMNAIDIVAWQAAFIVIARLVRMPTPGLWLGLGAIFGLGLLNKFSLLWLGAGLGLGLLATPHRRQLATPWPWVAGALALLIFSPHLLWQWANGFPTAEFMAVATSSKMVRVGPLDLFAQQALVMLPVALPIWVAGFFWLWRSDSKGPERIFAIVFVTTVVILIVNGTSRPNYLALAMPPLVSAGAVGLERLSARQRWRHLPAIAITLVAVVGSSISVMTVPIMAPDDLAGLRRELGFGAPRMENRKVGALDPHFADMIGWDVIVDAVADAWDALPADERVTAGIIGMNYSETGAVEQLGRARGLPTPASPHNSYWLWGHGAEEGATLLILARSSEGMDELFGQIEAVGTWDCGYCLPGRNDRTIFVARDPKVSFDEIWPALRHYD